MSSETPLTALDDRLDDLVRALGEAPDLDGLIDGLRAYERLLARLTPDHAESPALLSVAPVWASLAAVADEIRALRQIKENDRGNA